MSGWHFSGKKKNSKSKINYFGRDVEKKIRKKLEQACEEEKNKGQDKEKLQNFEMYDGNTGEFFYSDELVKEKFNIPEELKCEKSPEKNSCYTIPRKNTWRPFKEIIKADVTIVCIEITEDIEKIAKFVKASLKFFNTKFYKFIFFSNNIYSTKIYMKSLISEEKLLEIIKVQKEISSILNSNDILLYDAIDEAMTFSKENEFCNSRIITAENDKFILEERKYLFVVSGQESGSDISKEELQKLLSKVRTKDSDMHVVLTKSENLLKMLPLGFRTIKSY